jgi:uncharacterized protein YraI
MLPSRKEIAMTPKYLYGRARLLLLPLLALVLAALPFAADAQNARAARWVNLRAGPAQDYPLVARYGPSAPLLVQGCTDGFLWCDVIGPDNSRGWIYGGNISYPYQQTYVPIISFGPQIGVPIVSFAVGAYWGSYYRDRPWYGRYPRYENHRPPPRPVVRPPGWNRPPHAVRPPGDHRPPNVRPPVTRPRPPDTRPPGVRPPDARPPGVRTPPDARPPGVRTPPDQRPPGVRSSGGQQAGGGRPAGSGPSRSERAEGPRPQQQR